MIILILGIILPSYLSISRFRYGTFVSVEFEPGLESQRFILSSLLTVLAIFTPLSLIGLQLMVSGKSKSNEDVRKMVKWGITSFILLFIDTLSILGLLMFSSFGGVSINLNLFPLLYALLIMGCGFSMLSLSYYLE